MSQWNWIDVDLQELSLADVPSLDAARELLVASAASSLDTEPGRIPGEIPARVMQEEWALFVDDVRSLSEEELATVEPLRTVFGGPTSSVGEELSREISALIVWQQDELGSAVRDWIFATLDTAGVEYGETFPGVCAIRLERADDYHPLRELLEDAAMDADDEGTWPESGLLFIPPYRHVLFPGASRPAVDGGGPDASGS